MHNVTWLSGLHRVAFKRIQHSVILLMFEQLSNINSVAHSHLFFLEMGLGQCSMKMTSFSKQFL